MTVTHVRGEARALDAQVHRWQAPPVHLHAFTEAIPTWTARTPPGTAIEVRLRVGSGAPGAVTWSDRAVLARWSSDPEHASTTVAGQALRGIRVDADTATAVPAELGGEAEWLEVDALLHGAPGGDGVLPEVERISVLTRGAAPARADIAPSRPRGVDIDIRLPRLSQRQQGTLPGCGGGDVWCSPTSLTMMLRFLADTGPDDAGRDAAGPDDAGPDDAGENTAGADGSVASGASPDVLTAVRGVWDEAYDGAGNWAFNTAWAAAHGYEAFLDTLPDLRAGEELLAAGEPFIASVTFDAAELPEAGYETGGHLLVVSGVTADGDVRVHDPAAPTAAAVRRAYPRAAFERAWLSREGSGGLVYRIRRRR